MKRTSAYIISGIMVLAVLVLIYALYPASPLPADAQIDRIIVLKSERKLQAFEHGRLLKEYRIALGKTPTGAKQYEGDNKTPEGIYNISNKTTAHTP